MFGAGMAAELIFTEETKQDLAEAYDWYEGCRIGLGEDFLSCVDAAIQMILRLPNSFAIVKGGYRRVMIRRFPYQIFYEALPDQVTIYGVIHASRDPKFWQERLK
jgi:plasmid stabilization system protein ParE